MDKCKIYGRPNFEGGQQYTQISMYEYIKIGHNILIQCHGKYMEMKMKKFNHML